MASDSESAPAADDLHAQIAHLREQVESLMQNKVSPAVADLTEKARDALHDASDTVRGQAETVAAQVKERPLTALLIAGAVGWLVGRAMR